ncbi:Peptidyl-prolyl cis-trans isomerase FKBP4 [Dirofilaria immitis]|nr:Peptidyl-prolyl cis-trans isomerase FKBP4 [Dirofilaria immitis]
MVVVCCECKIWRGPMTFRNSYSGNPSQWLLVWLWYFNMAAADGIDITPEKVIKGWDLGVATMKKGEKCDLICRADYAYGENGSPPKIPGGATLKFEIELLSWQGEDISPDRDGTITRSIIVEGEKYSSPTEGSTVKADEVGICFSVCGWFVQWSSVLRSGSQLHFREGSEVGLPEGVDRALRRFNKGEKSAIHLKGNRFTFGITPPPEYNLPPHAEIDFTLFLKEYEKVKASWELTGEEKLDAAEAAKERGTMFFKQGKLRLAAAKYMRIIELLEYEKSLENDAKKDEMRCCLPVTLTALEVDPKCVKALYRKALALQEQNDADEAIVEYKKCWNTSRTIRQRQRKYWRVKKLAQIREKEKNDIRECLKNLLRRRRFEFNSDNGKFCGKFSFANEVNEDAQTTAMETASPKSEMVN